MEIGERPWGSYYVLDEGPCWKVKRLEVLPGKRLSLQSHQHRDETWVHVAGGGIATIDGEDIRLIEGNVVQIPRGTKHRLTNDSDHLGLILIEVQCGANTSESDITRYEDDFGRIENAERQV